MKMAQKLPFDYTYPSQVKQKLMRAHADSLKSITSRRSCIVLPNTETKRSSMSLLNGDRRREEPPRDRPTARHLVLDFYSSSPEPYALVCSSGKPSSLSRRIRDHLWPRACDSARASCSRSSTRRELSHSEIWWDKAFSPTGVGSVGKADGARGRTGSRTRWKGNWKSIVARHRSS